MKEKGASDHPARFALVELVNIHDEGLDFHPIFRLVENVDVSLALDSMESFYREQGWTVEFEQGAKLEAEKCTTHGVHRFECVTQGKCGVYTISNVMNVLEVKTLDLWLNEYLMNEYLKENSKCVMYMRLTQSRRRLKRELMFLAFYCPQWTRMIL